MDLLRSYRQLLRYGYCAVDRREPQKRIFREYVRAKFRKGPAPAPETLANTVEFVAAAAQWTGLERRTIGSLVHVEYGRRKQEQQRRQSPAKAGRERAVADFNAGFYQQIVDGLNRTMNLCL